MKFKNPVLLILTFLVVYVSGTTSKAQAWFFESPIPQVQVQPRILIGYMLPTQNNLLNINTLGTISSIKSFQQSAKMEGVWLELVLPVKTVSPIGFSTSFGYFAPVNYRANENYWVIDNLSPGSPQVVERIWQTQTALYNFKFSIDYKFTESLTGMIGFLYDSFMTKYTNPQPYITIGNLATFDPAQQVGFNVSVGLPYAGVQYEQNLWSWLDLKAYIIGYPGLPGDVSYQESVKYRVESLDARTVHLTGEFSKEISSGYFYEALTQLSMPVWWGIGAGAFVKYSVYSGTLRDADVVTGATGVRLRTDINFMRNPFIIGANITALF